MCGLCSVAACRTAPTPSRQRRTTPRSVTGPVTVVNGELSRSSPTTSRPCARRTRTSASPRCPALPVTRTRSFSTTKMVGAPPIHSGPAAAQQRPSRAAPCPGPPASGGQPGGAVAGSSPGRHLLLRPQLHQLVRARVHPARPPRGLRGQPPRPPARGAGRLDLRDTAHGQARQRGHRDHSAGHHRRGRLPAGGLPPGDGGGAGVYPPNQFTSKVVPYPFGACTTSQVFIHVGVVHKQ